MKEVESFIKDKDVNNKERIKHVLFVLNELSKISDYENTIKITDQLLSFFPKENIREYNIILNENEIAKKKIVLESKPRFLRVMPTSSCNLSCIMCDKNPPSDIPNRTKQEVIKLMPYLEKIIWLGGEVFVYRGFEELLDVAAKYNVFQEITTNGQCINEHMAEKLVKYKVNMIVSIDTIEKETYEKIRRGGKFDNLCKNLSYLKKYRKIYNATNPMAINSVVMRSTYKNLEKLVDFAYEYGFSEVCLIPVSNTGPKEENIFKYIEPDIIEELEQIVARMKNNSKGIFIRNLIPFNLYKKDNSISNNIKKDNVEKNNDIKKDIEQKQENLEKKECKNEPFCGKDFFCRVPWKYLCVLSNQDIMPECYCNIERMLGNAKVDSLFDVWNGEVIQEYRRKVSNFDNSMCSQQCNSGFLANYKKF